MRSNLRASESFALNIKNCQISDNCSKLMQVLTLKAETGMKHLPELTTTSFLLPGLFG